MAFQFKCGNYISESGNVGFVEQMAGAEEGLRYIISLAEQARRLSTHPVFVGNATKKLVIREMSTEEFLNELSSGSKTSNINPPKKTGGFWRRILRKLLAIKL